MSRKTYRSSAYPKLTERKSIAPLDDDALTRALESAFVKHRVPFQIVKGLAFFDRKENRDVLAYLRLLVNPRRRRMISPAEPSTRSSGR